MAAQRVNSSRNSHRSLIQWRNMRVCKSGDKEIVYGPVIIREPTVGAEDALLV